VSFFAKLEQACAAFIERAFAKTFPSDLEPAQVARKLVSTMEARTRNDDGGHPIAPAAYAVDVNPEDYARLAEHQAYLEREWAALLGDLAARVDVHFDAEHVRVAMRSSDGVPLGAVDVTVLDERPQSQAALRRFRLRMVKGVPAYGVYLVDGRAQVGRSEESDVFLVDPSVSRAHAMVETSGAAPLVRDLGSTNGTFVNGKRIDSCRLQDGDELRFGNTQMRFEAQ
jgi:Protein of unknown function (DUF3662)/FHA domain